MPSKRATQPPEEYTGYDLWCRAYRYRPADFARDCIQWGSRGGLHDYQAEALDRLVENGRLAIRSPHGVGKTATDAISILWFALTRDGLGGSWKAPTTASAWRHLTEFLWPEVQHWARRLKWGPGGIPRAPLLEGRELQKNHLVLRNGSAFAIASNDPAKIEGAHADYLYYVLDEAKTIPARSWDAVEGAFAGSGADTPREAYALATSTPTDTDSPAGTFYDIHRRAAGHEGWDVMHITQEMAFASGAMSREWAENMRLRWGESSAMYQAKVLGNFPSGSSIGVISLSAVEAAVERWWRLNERGLIPDDWTVGALDVADGGEARSILGLAKGNIVVDLLDLSQHDPQQHMALIGAVRPYLLNGMLFKPDASGPGSAIVSRLRELMDERDSAKPFPRITLEPFNGANTTDVSDLSGELRFANVRAAAYWGLREELAEDSGVDLALPPEDELIADLTAPTWKMSSSGKILIESKADIKAKHGRTMDYGDVVTMLRWRGAQVVKAAGVAPKAPKAARQTAQGRELSHLHASRPHLIKQRGSRPTRRQ